MTDMYMSYEGTHVHVCCTYMMYVMYVMYVSYAYTGLVTAYCIGICAYNTYLQF